MTGQIQRSYTCKARGSGGFTKISGSGFGGALCGGSEETHGVMRETATKINEHLDRRGQRREDVSISQLRDICESIHR